MKHTSISIIVFSLFWLAACNPQTPLPSQPGSIQDSPSSAAAYLARGDQYFGLKDYDRAIADYSQAIFLMPDFAEAYNNRGLAYALKGKDNMVKAIADYSQAIQLRPDYAYAVNNRGVAYMASGHPEDALQDFDRAIQLQPDFPQAHSNRGNYYLRDYRYGPAFIDFLYAEKILVLYSVIAFVGLLLLGIFIYRKARRSMVKKR